MTDPFLRWPGGKARLLPRLRPLLRVAHGRWVEPFVGAGSVFFDLRPPRALISDLNAELVATYQAVAHDVESVVTALARHEFSAERYGAVRDVDPAQVAALQSAERAARFIYLNRCAFNGLQRQNAAGKPNAAYGGFDRRKLPALEQRIRACARELQRAEFMTGDFETTLARVQAGDLVFADPPYHRTFVGYTGAGFTEEDQRRLARILGELAAKGVKVLTTNADTELVRELYSGPAWHVHELPIRRNIAGDASSRKSATELGFTNYEPDPSRAFSMPKDQPVNMTGDQTREEGPSVQAEGGMVHHARRLGDADVQMRTGFVQELVRLQMGRPKILKAFRQRFGDVSTRAIDGYVRRAKEAFAIDAVATPTGIGEARTAEREAFAAKVERDIQEAKAAGVWNAVSSLRRLEAEVRGLRQLRPAEHAQPAPHVSNTTNIALVLNDTERAHRTALLERVLERRRQESAVEADGAAPDEPGEVN